MTGFTTDDSNLVSRADAIRKIGDMAREQGYRGTFKVTYDGQIIATHEALPEQVDMSKVRISAMLNNA